MKSLMLGTAILVAAMPRVARAELESSSKGPAAESRDKPRAWGVSIRPFMGYDGNVQLVPDQTFFEGETSSFFGGLNVDGRVRIFDDDPWTIASAARVENIWYSKEQSPYTPGTSDDQKDYNLAAVHPTASVIYRNAVLNRPISLATTYAFRFESGDVHAMGLKAYTLGFSASVTIQPDLAVTLFE